MLDAAVDQYGTDLWAITCYFNPAGYRRKLANYHVFRQHLSIPLVAAELGYGPDFELTKNDADILVQLRGGDILWQKERLLNVLLRVLPSSCRKVVWIDCDVVFEANHWAERTSLLLERFLLVQPFSHVYRMPDNWQPGHARLLKSAVRHSIPFLIESGVPAAECLGTASEQMEAAPGHAWAASRELLERHHLYDTCIIGGGDSAMVRAAYGRFEDAMRFQHMRGRRRDHYMAWANPFYGDVRTEVASVEGSLLHLWHGNVEHRRYHERWKGLAHFQFDPFDDIAIDCNGVWRWSSDKREMHDYVREYFLSRREDG